MAVDPPRFSERGPPPIDRFIRNRRNATLFVERKCPMPFERSNIRWFRESKVHAQSEVSIVIVFSILAPSAANAQLYHVVDLGTLGGAKTVAASINKSGRITGLAVDPLGGRARFSRTASYMPINPGTDDLGFIGAGVAINDGSIVCGYTEVAEEEYHACIVTTSFLDLGTFGGVNSAAYGINATGKVVGEADLASGNHHGFLFAGGIMRDLLTLGGQNSSAYGINSTGKIVGSAENALGQKRAF